jgi:predicted hydrolase (HD superfamily)
MSQAHTYSYIIHHFAIAAQITSQRTLALLKKAEKTEEAIYHNVAVDFCYISQM